MCLSLCGMFTLPLHDSIIRGMYRKRLRYFVDGLVIGSEGFIRKQIDALHDKGQYLSRQNPIPHLNGVHLSLREQRSTIVGF
jgi:hypothetical protein